MKVTQIPLRFRDSEEDASHVADTYFITEANRAAIAYVRHILEGHSTQHAAMRLIVSGPPRSGKSLLLRYLSEEYKDVDFFDIPKNVSWDEEISLFHVLNKASENKRFVCMVCEPDTLERIHLPDLSSRLISSLRIEMPQPDEHMLKMLLNHAFAERQLSVSADVIMYCATHLPRSYEAPQQCVNALDRYSLEKKRSITLKLAAECIDIWAH